MANETTKSIQKTIKYLESLSRGAVPWAVRGTVNSLAFEARKQAQKNIEQEFVNRNQYTKRQVVVEKAKQKNIADMASKVGHTEEYMRDQEFGAVKKSDSRYKWIALSFARVSRSFSRLPRRDYYKGRISLIDPNKIKPGLKKKQRSVAEFFLAKQTKRHIIRSRGGDDTVLRVDNVKKIGRGKVKAKLTPLYTLADRTYIVKRKPWLRPAVDKVLRSGITAKIFHKEASMVIKRLKA